MPCGVHASLTSYLGTDDVSRVRKVDPAGIILSRFAHLARAILQGEHTTAE